MADNNGAGEPVAGNWFQRHWRELLSPGMTLAILGAFLTFVYGDLKDDLTENKELVRTLQVRLETSTDALRQRVDGLADAVSESREAVSGRLDAVQTTLNDRISNEIRAVEQRQVDFAVQQSALTNQVNSLTRSVESLALLQKGSLGDVPGLFLKSKEMFISVLGNWDAGILNENLPQDIFDRVEKFRNIAVSSGELLPVFVGSYEYTPHPNPRRRAYTEWICGMGGGDVCESDAEEAFAFTPKEAGEIEGALRAVIEAASARQ